MVPSQPRRPSERASAYDAYVTHHISMKYYGLSGHIGREEEGEEKEEKQPQPPLTSAKRSFDIPLLLLRVTLPSLLPESKNIRAMQRNAVSSYSSFPSSAAATVAYCCKVMARRSDRMLEMSACC